MKRKPRTKIDMYRKMSIRPNIFLPGADDRRSSFICKSRLHEMFNTCNNTLSSVQINLKAFHTDRCRLILTTKQRKTNSLWIIQIDRNEFSTLLFND